MFQKGASRPSSRVILIGMWLIFGSLFLQNLPNVWHTFLALVYPVFQFPGMFVPHYNFFAMFGVFLLSIGLEAVFVAILVKVTRNYRGR